MQNQISAVKKLLILSFGHMVNDWYMNFIQSMLPILVAAGLSVTKSGFLVSTFTITSSLMQPVIGYVVDKNNQKWFVYVGTLFMAVLLSIFGLIKSYPLLMFVVGIAGFGTAAFHPQASAMATAISSPEKRGANQAFFIAAGNIGWALTPLIAVPIVVKYGLTVTPVFILPGLAAFILLLFASSKSTSNLKKEYAPLLPALRSSWKELMKIMFVVAFRSFTYFGMVSYLSLYLRQRNVSLILSSRLLFLMLFAGALGGFAGGVLSDRFGRIPVLIISLFSASVFFWFFLSTPGVLSYIMLGLAGASLLASFSITVVLAQSLISKNAAMASGLMLGFGTGVGGLGVGLIGLLIDSKGVTAAILLLTCMPAVAGLLSFNIRKKEEYNIA